MYIPVFWSFKVHVFTQEALKSFYFRAIRNRKVHIFMQEAVNCRLG